LGGAVSERVERPPLRATDGATWTGLFGAPLTWFASQQASYILVPWACHGGPQVTLHLVNLVALLLVAGAGALAWRDWRRAGRQEADASARPAARARFFGLMGLMLCALFGLVILAQATGAWFFGPCVR
jgi:hypothetical protein